MQIINVDLIPGKVMPILHASQFDKGRSLGVKLYNGGAVFELSGAEDLTAAVRKPDGNIVTETLTNAGGSLVEIITTEQMTACAGGSLCEIKIENAGDVIGTANFVLEVEKDPTDGGIASQSEINNLATQVADLVSEQYDSNNVIFDAVPTAGHGNGYTVTSEGIKDALDAINNPDASAVNYDNTDSGLAATNAQDAIDEVNDKADTNAANIGDLSQLTTTDKSSLVGAVNTLAPTAYTQATRSSALSSGALGFVKIGKVVIANLNYTTNTSNVSTHDTVLYSDLPPAISNIYLNFVDEAGNVTRVRVGTDGKMHLHYSSITANKEINGSFVYLSA